MGDGRVPFFRDSNPSTNVPVPDESPRGGWEKELEYTGRESEGSGVNVEKLNVVELR